MLHFFTKNGVYLVIFFYSFCEVYCDDYDRKQLLEDFIPDLYFMYRKSLDNDESSVTFRRVLKNNKEYQIHVNKLKDVNGLKRHNLIVKGESDGNALIYISNPVETRIPHAYLSLEEFKNELTGRILRQREDFDKQSSILYATLQPVQVHRTSKKQHKLRSLHNSVTVPKFVTTKRNIMSTVKPTPKSNLKFTLKGIDNTYDTKLTSKYKLAITTIKNLNSTTEVVENIATEKFKNMSSMRDKISTADMTDITLETGYTEPAVVELTSIKKEIVASFKATTLEVSTTEKEITTKEHTTVEHTTVELTTEVPITELPANEVPATEVPATEVPATEVPATEVPATEVPAYEVPATEVPAIKVPATEVPATEVPATEVPATEVPTTVEPSKEEPTTEVPFTKEITTTKKKRTTLGRPLVYIGGY